MVVIQKGTSSTPPDSTLSKPGFLCHLSKGAVAIVAKTGGSYPEAAE